MSIALTSVAHLSAQPEHVRFRHLAVEDGLSQSTILAIKQDMLGFMWFGTADGLNLYDGYEFRVFRHDPANPSSISDNEIMAIMDDKSGRLWIGTAGGIDLLNLETEKCTHFSAKATDTTTLSDNYVTSFYTDSRGDIWVGTSHGLNKYNPADSSFTRFYLDIEPVKNVIWSILETRSGELLIGADQGLFRLDRAKNRVERLLGKVSLDSGTVPCSVRSLLQDSEGNIWAGSDHGLFRFDQALENERLFTPGDGMSSQYITALHQSKMGHIWIGTDDGLNRYDPGNGSFMYCKYNERDKFSLSNNMILSVGEAKGGILWFGSSSGLNKMDPLSFQFNPITIHPSYGNDLVNNKVWAIDQGPGGLTWLGTEGGLHLYDPMKRSVTRTYNSTGKEGLTNNVIRCISWDPANNAWIGTDGGLFYYDRRIDQFQNFTHIDGDSSSLSSNSVRSLAWENDQLWVGTANGLTKFDTKSGECYRFYFEEDGHQSFQLNSIRHLLREGRVLWIASEGGLIEFDTQQETYKVHAASGQEGALSHNFTRTLHIDVNKELWVGTSRGLNRFNRTKDTFEKYGTGQGMPNEVVYAILEDSKQHLWITTNKGIAKFNPVDGTFINYDMSDGLQSHEFNTNAAFSEPGGLMIFGGINGINRFHPDSIKESSYEPRVVLTGFEIFNETVGVNEQSPLRKSIVVADSIFLDYRDNSFTFRFSALDYTSSEKNKFRYQLKGFEPAWNQAVNRNYATYTNIPGGTYRFTVQVANRGDNWEDNSRSLTVIVASPLWDQPWFKISAALLLVGLGVLIFQTRTNEIRSRNQKLQRIVEERTQTLKQSKEALASSENLFRNIYERSPVGIAYLGAWDPKFKKQTIIQCNQQFCDILGYAEEEITTMSIADITHPGDLDKDMEANRQVVMDKNRKFYHRKKRLIHKTGKIVYATAAVAFIRDEEGKVKFQIAMFDDVTEEQIAREKLKQAQAQLIQSDKMASLGQLTAGIAHEINNPVNFIATGITGLDKNLKEFLAINGAYEKINIENDLEAQLLEIHQKKNSAEYEEIKRDIDEMIEAIKEGADRAAKIVSGLQTFAYNSDSEFVNEDVHKGLDSTLLLLSNKFKSGIILEKQYEASHPTISCLPGQLNQVFMNIITNAIQAVEEQENPKVIIRTESTEEKVVIKITDNGTGIPNGLKQKIFEPFYTTKPVGQGTGLGLAISYNIIVKHKGTIEVESSPGNTTFIITLPVTQG